MAPFLITSDHPHRNIPNFFIARRYASTVWRRAVYIVSRPCVCLSVRLVRDRGTARRQVVQRDPRRDIVVQAAYCSDVQQWRGRAIHVAYCYRRAALLHSLSIHAACCYWGYGRTTGWPTYRLCLAFLVWILVVANVMYTETYLLCEQGLLKSVLCIL